MLLSAYAVCGTEGACAVLRWRVWCCQPTRCPVLTQRMALPVFSGKSNFRGASLPAQVSS
eukprot:3455865-Rhodomonas_salina.1